MASMSKAVSSFSRWQLGLVKDDERGQGIVVGIVFWVAF